VNIRSGGVGFVHMCSLVFDFGEFVYMCVCFMSLLFCFILFCVWCALVVGRDFLAPNEDIVRFRCGGRKPYTLLLCMFL